MGESGISSTVAGGGGTPLRRGGGGRLPPPGEPAIGGGCDEFGVRLGVREFAPLPILGGGGRIFFESDDGGGDALGRPRGWGGAGREEGAGDGLPASE